MQATPNWLLFSRVISNQSRVQGRSLGQKTEPTAKRFDNLALAAEIDRDFIRVSIGSSDCRPWKWRLSTWGADRRRIGGDIGSASRRFRSWSSRMCCLPSFFSNALILSFRSSMIRCWRSLVQPMRAASIMWSCWSMNCIDNLHRRLEVFARCHWLIPCVVTTEYCTGGGTGTQSRPLLVPPPPDQVLGAGRQAWPEVRDRPTGVCS